MKTQHKKKAHAKRLELQKTYRITDAGGKNILDVFESALMTVLECQEVIGKDGLKIEDRWGQQKPHPLLSVLRDARAQVLSSLKSLCLDLEPLKGVGRPGLYDEEEED